MLGLVLLCCRVKRHWLCQVHGLFRFDNARFIVKICEAYSVNPVIIIQDIFLMRKSCGRQLLIGIGFPFPILSIDSETDVKRLSIDGLLGWQAAGPVYQTMANRAISKLPEKTCCCRV